MRRQYEKPIVYAVKHNDQERMKSQSGAAFAYLSDLILEQGGVIYGCIFNEDYKAVHSRAESKEERDGMRYSKYVQSDMLDSMKAVLADLRSGRTVLFSGTSCQVAGLQSFVELSDPESSERLFCVDILCKGVPSPLVWKDYLDWERGKVNSPIKRVLCRNKRQFGWKSHVVTIDYENGETCASRVFPRIFKGNNVLRPSCYECPYKSILHPGDVTIADYWGIDEAAPGFKDDKGVSLVLVNSSVGEALFESGKDRLVCLRTRIEDSMQKPLREPCERPKTRERFWRDYASRDFSYIAYWYGVNGFWARVYRKLKIE